MSLSNLSSQSKDIKNCSLPVLNHRLALLKMQFAQNCWSSNTNKKTSMAFEIRCNNTTFQFHPVPVVNFWAMKMFDIVLNIFKLSKEYINYYLWTFKIFLKTILKISTSSDLNFILQNWNWILCLCLNSLIRFRIEKNKSITGLITWWYYLSFKYNLLYILKLERFLLDEIRSH